MRTTAIAMLALTLGCGMPEEDVGEPGAAGPTAPKLVVTNAVIESCSPKTAQAIELPVGDSLTGVIVWAFPYGEQPFAVRVFKQTGDNAESLTLLRAAYSRGGGKQESINFLFATPEPILDGHRYFVELAPEAERATIVKVEAY